MNCYIDSDFFCLFHDSSPITSPAATEAQEQVEQAREEVLPSPIPLDKQSPVATVVEEPSTTIVEVLTPTIEKVVEKSPTTVEETTTSTSMNVVEKAPTNISDGIVAITTDEEAVRHDPATTEATETVVKESTDQNVA